MGGCGECRWAWPDFVTLVSILHTSSASADLFEPTELLPNLLFGRNRQSTIPGPTLRRRRGDSQQKSLASGGYHKRGNVPLHWPCNARGRPIQNYNNDIIFILHHFGFVPELFNPTKPIK